MRSMQTASPMPLVFVVMGVSGSGKSAVASAVARSLNAAFLDADFLHPRANVVKMTAGEPLDDADRAPWLAAVNDAIFAMRRTHPISLIACSALKRRYRDRLREGNDGVVFFYLKASRDEIAARLGGRAGHFFRAGMLDSQWLALEEPTADERDVTVIDASRPIEKVIEETVEKISALSGLAQRALE